MAGAASQAGDADSSRAPGLTSGLQGSMNVKPWCSIVGATVTVHQFFCILLKICFSLGQSAPDNRGTEFIIGYMENYIMSNPSFNLELFVTTSRTTTVSVRVRAPKVSGLDSSFSITAGQVKQLSFRLQLVFVFPLYFIERLPCLS